MQVVGVKEKTLNYANKDGEFEENKYENLPWDKYMEPYMSEEEKQFLLDQQ